MATTVYCLKCRAQREPTDPERVTMKNGREAIKAKCSVCGRGLFRIVGQSRSQSS